MVVVGVNQSSKKEEKKSTEIKKEKHFLRR